MSKRLLCIDDEEGIRNIITHIAETAGYEATSAEDMSSFIRALNKAHPQVCVIDLQMPDADGIEIIRYLAESEYQGGLVLLSGVERRILDAAAKLAREHGLKVLDSVQKPIHVKAFREILAEAALETPDFKLDEIRRAIAEGEFLTYFQPKSKLKSDGSWTSTGGEVLLRWQHPERGLLMPGHFIEEVIGSGEIKAVTEYVIKEAARHAKTLMDQGLPYQFAVNLVPSLLDSLDFPNQIENILREEGIPLHALTLELTETHVMSDSRLSLDIMSRIRLKGMGLSIDDFGTGYSSFVQLYRMPFNELKIDRSFVQDVVHDRESQAIVRSMLMLARELELKVVAEGVEDEEALKFLADLQCDSVQGFYIAKPMPPDEYLTFMQKHGDRESANDEGQLLIFQSSGC